MSARNPLEKNEAIARKFQLLDRAVIEGNLIKPKEGILGTYLWFSNFKFSSKTFSMGALFLGIVWYIHYGLTKEAFIIFLVSCIFSGFVPPEALFIDFVITVITWIAYGFLFTSTLYAKYQIKGNITINPNIFKTIFLTILIGFLGLSMSVGINYIVYPG